MSEMELPIEQPLDDIAAAEAYRELVSRMGRFLAFSAAGSAFDDGLSLQEWVLLGSLDDPATAQLDPVQLAISVGMSFERLKQTGRSLRKKGFITHEDDGLKITESGRAAKGTVDLAVASSLKPFLANQTETFVRALRSVRALGGIHSRVEPMI